MSVPYAIGGLEINLESDKGKIKIDGVTYQFADKFKFMLRDTIINWETFLEIYGTSIEYEDLFQQVVKLLNIQYNEDGSTSSDKPSQSTLKDILMPVVKRIYELPIEAHIACMMKQFVIYEPVSIAISELFSIFKRHYEMLVERFIKSRNSYLLKTNLDKKVKLNDWDTLVETWYQSNGDNQLESSSITLLFLNPPKKLKSGIHYGVPGHESVMTNLKTAVSKFQYPGFCPKVPIERLMKLLAFPVKEFVTAIRVLDKEMKFPNYDEIDRITEECFATVPKKPEITDGVEREQPPKHLIDAIKDAKKAMRVEYHEDSAEYTAAKIELIKWYVGRILDVRRRLADQGIKLEEYYIEMAERITQLNKKMKELFYNFQ